MSSRPSGPTKGSKAGVNQEGIPSPYSSIKYTLLAAALPAIAILVTSYGMRYTSYLLPLAGLLGLVKASNNFQTYSIYAYGINATFIPYGARLTSLYVHDKDNTPREVVVGYDDPNQYLVDTETAHTYFGAIVGRYANRIKNGTFSIDDQEYHIPENEHGGLNTLHGGFIGYDQRNWTVTSQNTSSITFTLFDPSGYQGFPGNVVSHVTYTVSPATDTSRGKYTARIVSLALDDPTPIMLSTHVYWNIGSFISPTILNDTLQLPYGKQIIGVDGLQIPTGEIIPVDQTSIDFTSPKQIGSGALVNHCGDGCTGLDTAFILSRPDGESATSTKDTQLIWSSADTGLTMKIRTNQQSFQLYSCVGQDGTQLTHASQGTTGSSVPVEQYGCLVIEPQQWIDGINHPEWGQTDREEFSATSLPSVNWAEYDFST